MLPLDRTSGVGLGLVREDSERSMSPVVEAEGGLAFSETFAGSSEVLLGGNSSLGCSFGVTKDVAAQSDVSAGVGTSAGFVDPATGSPCLGG